MQSVQGIWVSLLAGQCGFGIQPVAAAWVGDTRGLVRAWSQTMVTAGHHIHNNNNMHLADVVTVCQI